MDIEFLVLDPCTVRAGTRNASTARRSPCLRHATERLQQKIDLSFAGHQRATADYYTFTTLR